MNIIDTLIAAIVLSILSFLVLELRRRHQKRNCTIRLHLKTPPSELNIQFKIRHVRDGKDVVDDKGPLLNRDLTFKRKKNKTVWCVHIHFLKNLGFQFKCFVEFPPLKINDVRSFLQQNGLNNLSEDESVSNRIYFILPNVPTCETVDHYVNNFFHPNIEQIDYDANLKSSEST